MKIAQLEWDDENVEHIARHQITPVEVEEVCFEQHIAYRATHGRYVLYGQTANRKYIKVVLVRLYRTVFRPKTAYEMSDREKRGYRKRIKEGKR
jgi:uncharacterized DUF497 family protein